MANALVISGGRTLRAGGLDCEPLFIDGERIPHRATVGRRIDASGLLVLPGLVDIHGDAFERQLMPRPGVAFDADMALMETDRQLVANGITTAFHAVTWSWEPGLRGRESTLAILTATERLRPRLAADTRIHLRHETFNLAAESEIAAWIGEHRIDLLAFNDHLSGTVKVRNRPDKMAAMIERSGIGHEAFQRLIDATYARASEVSDCVGRLAAACRKAELPMLSHDDMSPSERRQYHKLGCKIAEFPIDVATAAAAAECEDWIVFGAPNVVRGGSHTGCPSAAEMVRHGLCSVLASDYYYPALLEAPLRLAASETVPFEEAWRLVSSHPARAVGLNDRGEIAAGYRADIIIVDSRSPLPEAVLTITGGGIVRCTRPSLLA